MILYIMRHANAGLTVMPRMSLEDRSRPLTDIGETQTRALAAYMSKNDLVPDVIFASDDTERTRQTASILAEELLGDPKRWTVDQTLSEQKNSEMAVIARAMDKSIKRPLLVMHSDTVPRLRNLKGDFDPKPDPIANNELRVLKVKRKSVVPPGKDGHPSVKFKEKQRVLPSDVDSDLVDMY